MTMTDRPIPADLAFPGGEEPLSPDDLVALEAAAEGGQITLEDLLAGVLEAAETDDPEAREERVAGLGLDPMLAHEGDGLASLARVARWRVEDDGGAEWAARKLAAVEAEQAEARELAAQWRAEIDRWLESRLRPLGSRHAFFEGLLVDYLRRRMDDDPKLRTITLPSAALKGSVSKPKVGLAESEEAQALLIEWADEHLEAEELAAVVKTTRKPMVSELRKVATVSEQRLGDRLHVRLECGHDLELFRPDGETQPETPKVDDAADATEADHLPCGVCEPEFGEPQARKVVAVETRPVIEPVVRDNDTGQVVPGAVVEPTATTYKVKVGG